MHYYIWYSSHYKSVKSVQASEEDYGAMPWQCWWRGNCFISASPALRQHIKHQYLLFGNLKFHTHLYCVRKSHQTLKRVTGSQRRGETRTMMGWSSSNVSIHLHRPFFLSIRLQLVLDVVGVSWITAGHRADGGRLTARENEHKLWKPPM